MSQVSAIYAGTVRHRRLGQTPAAAFTHRIALLYVDLDELPSLLGGRLARTRPGVVRVRAHDHLGSGDAARALIEERTDRPAPRGPVRVLLHPRVLGTCFNPVTFTYAFDADERLDSVVAQVTNTPWGDRHAYVLRGDGPVLKGAHAKALHVSPFQTMDRTHHWAASAPGATLSVHIENRAHDGADPDFDATLSLERRPLTPASLRRYVAASPAGTLRTLALIYGHAAALKVRGAAHFRPPTAGATT